MSNFFQIEFVGDSIPQVGTFYLSGNENECVLKLCLGSQTFNATASDYFEALCMIRRQLEPFGIRPACYGASLNVFPSGMARDMGGGLHAYRLTLGQAGRIEDLVSIFETGEDIQPATVEEQSAFHDSWLNSF